MNLDERVHEVCQALTLEALNSTDDEAEQERIISAAESRASEINNQGEAAQLAFLASHGA